MVNLAVVASVLIVVIVAAVRFVRRRPGAAGDEHRIRNVIRSPHH
ncbi:hypothetical protein [Streptomyces sp. NBC_00459]